MSQVDTHQDPDPGARASVADMHRSATDSADSRRLAFVFLCGPIAWGAQLLIGYFLVSVSCVVTGNKWPLYALSGAAAVITLFAGALAAVYWREYLRRGHSGLDDLDASDDTRAFIVTSGTLLSSIFLILILVTAVMAFFLSPCPIITLVIP